MQARNIYEKFITNMSNVITISVRISAMQIIQRLEVRYLMTA